MSSEAFAIAVQHHQAGQLQAAEQIYRQVLAAAPNNAEALHLLGVVGSQTGRHELAVECIGRAIELKDNDASFHCNLASALQGQGKLAEAIASCRKALALKPDYAMAWYNLGSALHAQGNCNDAAAAYRRAVELQPGDWMAWNDLGTALEAAGKTEEAADCFRRAVALQPEFAAAHNNLGNCLQDQLRPDEAIVCHRRALELEPGNPDVLSNLGTALEEAGQLDEAVICLREAVERKPTLAVAHNNLGSVLLALGKTEDGADCFRRALELQPNYAEAFSNLGIAHQQLRQFDEALAVYERALSICANWAHAHFGRATLKLLQGDFDVGWPEYEWRWKSGDLVQRRFARPLWDGRPLGQRTILLHAEQGLGDTIQFVRFAEMVKKQNPAASVIVECQRPLVNLLAACRGIDRLVARGDALPEFDVHAPLMSLPRILKTSLETIPADTSYLFADGALVEKWHEKLSPIKGMRVGITWRGRSRTRHRDVPIEFFEGLARISGVRLISLHKQEVESNVQGPRSKVETQAGAIIDLGEFDTVHGAFMDTAAVMMNLDLVISSDTAIPHLAGALGVPVWVALPFVPDWRWLLDRSDSPWYPTMRLFRQKRPGDWVGVFDEIHAALTERAAVSRGARG